VGGFFFREMGMEIKMGLQASFQKLRHLKPIRHFIFPQKVSDTIVKYENML
jgi:hypothetical protein